MDRQVHWAEYDNIDFIALGHKALYEIVLTVVEQNPLYFSSDGTTDGNLSQKEKKE